MQDDPQNRIDSLEEHLRNRPDKATEEAISNISFYSSRHANRLFKALKGDSIKAFAARKFTIRQTYPWRKFTKRPKLPLKIWKSLLMSFF